MAPRLAELLKNASPELLDLRETNFKLYKEAFDRGRKAEARRAKYVEEERREQRLRWCSK